MDATAPIEKPKTQSQRGISVFLGVETSSRERPETCGFSQYIGTKGAHALTVS